jgi:RimJ/RimL family protein N-acetyltransferase
MIELREPFPDYAWPLVWAWTEKTRHKLADDFSPQTLEAFVEYSEALAGRARTWGVWSGSKLGGLMVFEPMSPVTGMAHVVFRRDFWGSAITGEAARLFLSAIFEARILKVSGFALAHNHAVHAMYRRIGFRQEGLLRSQTLQAGQPVDLTVWGLTKEEFHAISISSADTVIAHRRRGSRRGGSPRQQGGRQEEQEHEHIDPDVHAVAAAAPGLSGRNPDEAARESQCGV